MLVFILWLRVLSMALSPWTHPCTERGESAWLVGARGRAGDVRGRKGGQGSHFRAL